MNGLGRWRSSPCLTSWGRQARSSSARVPGRFPLVAAPNSDARRRWVLGLGSDLRGYHLSDKPPDRDAYQLRHLVADVAALVRATGEPKAHIVGHDWGGIIAWTFAGMHPELTDKLVILNAPHMRIYLRRVRHPPQLFQSWYILFFQIPSLPETLLSANRFQLLRSVFRRTPARAHTFSDEQIYGYINALAKPGALTAALNYYRANFRSAAVRLAASAQIASETSVDMGRKGLCPRPWTP